MTDRLQTANDFIARAGWAEAARRVLAGDASNRRYDRLTLGDHTAILMDAPPQKDEDVRPFMQIAQHLSGLGYSAPEILAADVANGFLLLEDLGDALYARVVEDKPETESLLYSVAIDFLADLHRHAPPIGLAPYDVATMAELASMAVDWYLPAATGAPASDAQRAEFYGAVASALQAVPETPPVLILRDFHAENLIWLPERAGLARVGLLDFQDARAGHPAYDLISLLEDARRDVSKPLQDQMMARYLAATGQPATEFAHACAAIAAQRNLRIVGIFARLCIRDAKPHYIDLMARVWGHLLNDLSHPALADLRDVVENLLPPPDAEICNRIKSKCPTSPNQ